jgi:hypothetical protein
MLGDFPDIEDGGGGEIDGVETLEDVEAKLELVGLEIILVDGAFEVDVPIPGSTVCDFLAANGSMFNDVNDF